MTTIDSLYQQLNLQKETAGRYNLLAEASKDDQALQETLFMLKNKAEENAKTLENTINHLLEKEVW